MGSELRERNVELQVTNPNLKGLLMRLGGNADDLGSRWNLGTMRSLGKSESLRLKGMSKGCHADV